MIEQIGKIGWWVVEAALLIVVLCLLLNIILGRDSGAFIAGVATDPVNHLVYASDSPGGAPAAIWRYNELTGLVTLYLTSGTLPAAGSANANVYVSTTGTRPWDVNLIPGGQGTFSFAFGIAVGPDGSFYVTEDPYAGSRAGRGKVWVAPLVQ